MNYKGEVLSLSHNRVMAIVNITTNSFFDGGRYLNADSFVERIGKVLAEGASFIDLGACSTRPFSEPISQDEEIKAIEWACTLLKQYYPDVVLSIDTFRHKVAEAALDIWGEIIVNDVYSGDYDCNMIPFVAANSLPYIAMHQADINGSDAVLDIIDYFSSKIDLCERKGIKDFIVDVGFGFNKSLEQNYQILSDYNKFSILDKPTLVGISRKSMIWKVLECEPSDALNGTSALHALLLEKGADILRVHDPKEAMEVVRLVDTLKKFNFQNPKVL